MPGRSRPPPPILTAIPPGRPRPRAARQAARLRRRRSPSAHLHVAPPRRSGDPPHRTRCDETRASHITYHTRRFEYAAEPTAANRGVIRDKDTGRPIAGITLQADGLCRAKPRPGHRVSRRRAMRRATIASSVYPKATGLSPPSPRPAKGQPYPTYNLSDPGRLALARADHSSTSHQAGPPGPRPRDRKATGQPVAGFVEAYSIADNPHIQRVPRLPRKATVRRAPSRPTAGMSSSPCRATALIGCQADPDRYREVRRCRGDQGICPQHRGLPHRAPLVHRPPYRWPRSSSIPRSTRRRWTSRSTPADR